MVGSRIFAHYFLFLVLIWIGSIAGSAPIFGSDRVFIRGYVVATVYPDPTQNLGKQRNIYLPGAEVHLIDLSTGSKILPVITDLSGRFTFKLDGKGAFRICVESQGFISNCFDRAFEVDRSNFVGTISLRPDVNDKSASVFGHLRLLDGKRPRILQPYLGVNEYATVLLQDRTGLAYKAAVNNFGEYVIPTVPVDDEFVLLTTIESSTLKNEVNRLTGLQGNRAYKFDLIIENYSPKLDPLVGINSTGKPAQIVRPGETLLLEAKAVDPDQDTLTYNWLITDGNGTLTDVSLSSTKWTLPSVSGRFSVTLLVSDRKGGHAEQTFSFDATTGGVNFSGNVISTDGTPQFRAVVEVNGKRTRTGQDGWFTVQVLPSDRYVMNIRQPGFGVSSQIFAGSIAGGSYKLVPAEVHNVDPTKPIAVANNRRKRTDCQGPTSLAIDWEERNYLQQELLQWQDGKGNIISAAEQEIVDPKSVQQVATLFSVTDRNLTAFVANLYLGESRDISARESACGPGIAVEIPPDSLVDDLGNPPSGNLDVSLSTVDLQSPGQMPGDYSATDSLGKSVVMESFGAGSIEISNGATRYNLKPGSEATVTIPIDRSQRGALSSLAPTMPLLYYDSKVGIWSEDGQLSLGSTAVGPAYITKVKHFSSMNADLLKTGQSCVSVVSGAGLPATYNIEVTLPPYTPGASPVVRTLPIDNSTSSEHVIYNLPNNTNIILVPIIDGVRPDGSPGPVPAGVFVVNSGGPQTATTQLPPGPPYYHVDASGNPIGPCMTRVNLANLAIPSAPDAPYQFLQGLDLQSANLTELVGSNPALKAEIEGQSTAYLNLIDPRQLRRDLIDFKARNHFGQPLDDANGELEASAAYANSGDLGFGRNMNCRRNRASDGNFDMACYVTNYGDHLTSDQTDAADASTQNAASIVATVAMEYSRVENPPSDPLEFPGNDRTVKFYVYAKAAPSIPHPGQFDGIVTQADLDGAGTRPVPQLCAVCHGGAYSTQPSGTPGKDIPAFDLRTDVFMGSRFLPFDLRFFTSPPAPNTLTAQQSNFRSLNIDIVKLVPQGVGPGDPVFDLVTEMYPGVVPAATQDPNAVVAGWDKGFPASIDRSFYLNVLSPACRTCHLTSPFGNLNFADKNQFRAVMGNVQTRVCDQHVMPHARRTHDLFWTSLGPNMAAQLQFYGQTIPGWDATSPNAQCGPSFTPGGNNAVNTFTSKIQPIFSGKCVSCHGTAAPFNANLALSSGNSYSNLVVGGVGVLSTEHPSTARVRPNFSSDSYLYRKVVGDHTSLPGPFSPPPTNANGGGPMPLGGVPLSANDQEEIRSWIDLLGAPGP